MTLALLPNNAMVLLYGGQTRALYPPLNDLVYRGEPTCAHCGYDLIAGWCSRCSLEEVFDDQNPGA